MRYLMISVICLAGMFFLTSCKEQLAAGKVVEDFSVTKITDDLTDSEIKTLFSASGLSFNRFEIMLPERTGITFSSEKFENGVSQGSDITATTYADKGLQKFIFCKRQEGNEIKFSVHKSSSSVGCGGAYIGGYHARTSSWIPIKKLSDTGKQPIYFLAANERGIESSSAEDFDLEAMVSKYDLAMVIYISVKESE